ncbi:MAG: hypothetical protein R3Y12_07190 [Clostridia bacterium]
MDIFFDALKFVFPFFIYLFQFAITFAIAFVFSLIPYFIFRKIMHNAYFFAIIFSVVLVFSSVFLISNKPLIFCSENYKELLTTEVKQQIYDETAGIYSESLPIFPIYIEIRSITSKTIKYDTKYLYFGRAYTEISDTATTQLILD